MLHFRLVVCQVFEQLFNHLGYVRHCELCMVEIRSLPHGLLKKADKSERVRSVILAEFKDRRELDDHPIEVLAADLIE